jgi:hypothetical protein
MIDLIRSIVNKDYVKADSLISETVELIMAKKLHEVKKACAAKLPLSEGTLGMNVPYVQARTGAMADGGHMTSVYSKDTKNVFNGGTVRAYGRLATKTDNGTQVFQNKRHMKDLGNNNVEMGGRSSLTTKLNREETKTTKTVFEQGLDKSAAELVRRDVVEGEIAPGEESSMARSELNSVTKDAKSIMSKVKGNKELEAWTQSKITKAADYLNSVADYMSEEEKENLEEARINIVKARIRGGKIQRRKKVSNVPGMTLRSGKLKRMTPAERRNRKMGQRRGKIKRKAKMNRAIMKRQRSLRKRKALGL